MSFRLKSFLKKTKYTLLNSFVSFNETPIAILGNQKSGTSIIAHLQDDYGGLSKSVDIPPLWGSTGASIIQGLTSFQDVAYQNKKVKSNIN